jgi:catechol 2,3-dioxygenase-like lactoylglutathione lyase family enzyme
MITVTGFDHVVITVVDVRRTLDFYTRALGMRAEEFKPNRFALHFGNQKINLQVPTEIATQMADGRIGNIATHPTPGSADLCFITDAEPEAVLSHLRSLGIEAITGVVERKGARGSIWSVYCRDPDGNLIEIANYPKG